MLFERVVDTLESLQIAYAVIGGQAVALRGHPRSTLDYDDVTEQVPRLHDDAQRAWQELLRQT